LTEDAAGATRTLAHRRVLSIADMLSGAGGKLVKPEFWRVQQIKAHARRRVASRI
jgi:hypothetical protein